MLEGLTHTLFGCNPKDIVATAERITCIKCHGGWFKDSHGKWIDHMEIDYDWERACLRN